MPEPDTYIVTPRRSHVLRPGGTDKALCGYRLGAADHIGATPGPALCRSCRPALRWYQVERDGDIMHVPACPICFDRVTEPGLVEATYSVAIESPLSPHHLMVDYLNSYHDSGHHDH